HVPPDAPADPADDTRHARWLLLAALAAGAALRGWLALTDQGIARPDEIHQSLEPAPRLVWGPGGGAPQVPRGVRNVGRPGLGAGLVEVFRALGLSRPGLYVPAAKLVFAAVGVLTAWATARLARRMGAGPLESAGAGALWALAAPAIYFAPRGLSEPLSAF